MQVKPKEVSADKATTPGQIDRPIATCSRGLFETWVLETEHPVIGWVGADWLDQGDAPNTYANDYIQGAWVMWQFAKKANATEALQPCGECHEGLQLIDPYDGGTYVTCKRCSGRGVVAVCPTCQQGMPADRAQPVNAPAAPKEPPVPIGIGRIEEQMPEGFGECAAIWNCDGNYWKAAIYVWDASFNDSTAVAKWFQNLGAKDVTIAHTLYSTGNGDRDGEVPEGGAREWLVEFSMKEVPHA